MLFPALTSGVKVDRFDRLRKKRNVIGYESAGVVSEREAREMHELATELRDSVLASFEKAACEALENARARF